MYKLFPLFLSPGIHNLLLVLEQTFGTKTLPGIPHSSLERWMPLGDLGCLGVHYLRNNSVFDWLSGQCLKQKSVLVQIMIPSLSTTSPVILIADLREVRDIVVKKCHKIGRALPIHYWFEVPFPYATTCMQTNTSFERQRGIWSYMLNPDFLNTVAVPTFEAAIQ